MSGSLWSRCLLLVLALALSISLGPAPAAGQETDDDGWILVGEDPADDAANDVAPGADADAVVTSARTDILALRMQPTPDGIVANITIGAAPAGTGGYMYRVVFNQGADRYYTCWTVQWVGGQVAEENTLGCSRFTEDTLVGPETTDDGVMVGEAEYNGTEGGYVAWPIAAADIGGDASSLTNVTAESWFRGVSACCAGSTTQTQYMWNEADLAPDTGSWNYTRSTANVTTPNVTIVAKEPNITVQAGNAARFLLTVGLNGTAPTDNVTVNVTASGLDDWIHTLEPSALVLGANNTTGQVRITISVAQSRDPQQVPFNVTACLPDDTCATADLVLIVDKEPEPSQAAFNTSAPTNNTTGPAADEEGLPAPAPVAVVAALVALAAWRRRR